MNTLSHIFRLFLFLVLALFGMAMAMVFMVSTAIAVAVLYVVARVKGRPFGVKAYWSQRRSGQGSGFQSRNSRHYRDPDVIDVEAREIP